jgi:hypothetical protein
MGQRASQPNGRSPTSQGRVRSANAPGTCAGNTSANKSPTKNYRNSVIPAGTLARQLSAGWPGGAQAFHRLSAHPALLGRRRPAICCSVSRASPVEPTEDFTSRVSAVTSQLRRHGRVSLTNAQPTTGAASGLTFDTRNLSSGCDIETNSESQGDLSCRRNKRTRLPRSVRLPHENRSGDRIW